MYSSSPQNQGSLSSLLALSPVPSSARETRVTDTSANTPNNFGNTLEHVRQSERQQERLAERQKLASKRADQAQQNAALDARARENTAIQRRDSNLAARHSEPNHPKEVREHSERGHSEVSSLARADETKQNAADESVNEVSASPALNESGAPVADTQNTNRLLPFVGDRPVGDETASSSDAAPDGEAISILLDPDAGAEAHNALLAGHLTEPSALDPDVAQAAAKAGLLAASASPLAAQTLAKNTGTTSTSALNDSLTGGDSVNALDSLLANKVPATKISAGGDSELANLAQGKQGEIPLEANAKELFSRLLGGQAESGPLTRERAAALPISAQAAPALDAVSRAIESLTPAGRGFVVQSSVPVAVGQPQWSQAVGDRVLWLAAQNITSAELRLDPPELGPMQVRVSVQNDQVQVTFTSPHANVREALDQGAARLRELFGEQGLNANVDVSDQALSRRQESGDGGERHGRRGGGDGEGEAGEDVVAEVAVANIRLVDHYA